MRRIADIGAAVIGTGFIGTVHVEALRRIGVQVRGVLGSTPERGAARAEALGVPRAYASLEDLLDDPTVDAVHVTSPNDLHLPQAKAVLAAGRHVICEKPLAMSAAESRELVELAARSGLVNAANFNIRYYPLNQHAHDLVSAGGVGDVRLVTGRYFQDWLLLETDWNWRLQPERGGALRAVGDIGSHWLDLTAFITGHRIVSVMAELTTFIEARREPTGPVETYSTDVAAETVDRDIATEDSASILLRFENGARGAVNISQISAGRKNSLQYEISGSDRLGRLGFGAARPDVDRASRATERDPDQEPGAHGAGRTCRGGAAGWSRRGVRRHLRRPLPGRLRRHRGRTAVRTAGLSDIRRRSRRDARQRRDRRERAPGSLGGRRARSGPGRRDDSGGCLMRLGLLTAPFPETPLDEVVDWTAANGFESIEIACWPRTTGPSRRYAGTSHIDVANLSAGEGSELASRIRSTGLTISGLGYYPNPLHPDPEHREQVIGHLRHVIVAAEAMDVPFVNTFMGADGSKNPDENWEEALRVWPDIVRFAEDHGRKLTFENCPMLFSYDEWPGGHNLATTPRQWRRILETWGGSVGLNFDPSHLILQMIDIPRFIREFGPHILHMQAKDLMIDREGLYERGIFSQGIGWQIPRLPGLGEVDWSVLFAALYRAGYDGDVIIEHEDRDFEGTDERVKRGFILARGVLRPYVV